MDITFDKNNNTLINLKKGKNETNIKLNLNATLEVDNFKIDSPGEYEIKEVFVEGIREKEGGIFYLLNIEKIKVCYLPIAIKELTDENIAKIGDVNLLIVNIFKNQNNKKLSEIILQLEPQIIIPSYEGKEELNEFLELRGIQINNLEFLNKTAITQKSFTNEKIKIILLNKN